MDDYRYLEPDDDLTLDEYGEFLEERFRDLSEIAHQYGRFCEQRGPKYSGKLSQHWQKYIDAADTVYRVFHELDSRDKL